MSSPADEPMRSDQLQSEARSDGATDYRQRARSSSGPRGPPSVSTPGMNEIPFEDDQLVGGADLRRARGLTADVQRVRDELGESAGHNFESFLNEFREDPAAAGEVPLSSVPSSDMYYVEQIKALGNKNSRTYGLSTVYVDFQHLLRWEEGTLATAVQDDYYRFQPYMITALNRTIQRHVPEYFRQHRQPGTSSSGASTYQAEASQEDSVASQTPNQQTDKIFTLAFYNLPLVSRVRDLKTDQIGKLLSISGTATRTSEVRPELSLATFTCEACNTVVPNIEQIFRYSEPTQCPNVTCGNRQGWRLDIRQSTFIDWQKVRIQENSSEIPTGSMPRTMDVILRGEMVERAKAGEKCIFTGILIVVPDVSQFRVPGVRPQATRDTQAPRGGDAGGSGVSGLKALGVRDLTYRMAFLANMVTPDGSTAGQRTYQQMRGQATNILSSLNQASAIDNELDGDLAQEAYLESLTAAEIDQLRRMVGTPNIYMRLVDSLAPMVYGHDVVKKGLLLQLMGGVSKTTPEGMSLRGDINVCIVGDPSTSKSQFLKYICSFLPRAVYTSGKASSAAGLTAAVVKDEETGEFTIEAGALMLADNGICAIDEFDKMDITDQVAIHEAMEQQTISIAKAGIQATLNARTSILAAANPVGGRYNRKTTLRANINMSAPIMSRFDLFFVVLDECNERVDEHLARHIVDIHRLRDEAVQPEFSTEQLQRYIRFARTFQPEFTEEAKQNLVARYKELRADDAQGGIGRNSYRITVRQLESMIRLSEAIAKANCVYDVTPEFVDEAFRLLRQSIISVEKDDVEMEDDEDDLTAGPGGIADDDLAELMADVLQADDDAVDGQRAHTPAVEAPRQPQRTQIKHDKYMSMLHMIVHRINDDRVADEDGVEEEDLLVWYLEQKLGEIESQEELAAERVLAKKVLKRMVKDNILMQIRAEPQTEENQDEARQQDVVYVIHPNCAVDEL